MVVALLVLMIAVFVWAVLWSGSMVAQGYWYSQPTAGLPWRSAVGGLAVGGFIGAWCALDASVPGRYDTLFNFSQYDTAAFDRVWSVNRDRRGTESEQLYERARGTGERADFRDSNGKRWSRSSTDSMAVGIVIEEKQPGGEAKRTRFDADLEERPDPSDPQKQRKMSVFRGAGDGGNRSSSTLRYTERGGSRYIEENDVGTVTTERWSLLLGNLGINFLHFVVWFLVFWPLLRYGWGESLGMAAAFWLVFTLAVLPVLFTRTRAPGPLPPAAPVPAVARP